MNETTFTDKLREVGLSIARGDCDSVKIPERYVMQCLDGRKSANKPAAYIRQIIGRVPEVEEKGRVSVSRCEDLDPESNNYGDFYYDVRIVQGEKRKVYNKAALEKAVAKAKRQVAEQMLKVSPSLANYTPEEYATLAKAVAEFHAIIKDNFLAEEE